MDIHSQYLFSFFSAYSPSAGCRTGIHRFRTKSAARILAGCGELLTGDSGEIVVAFADLRNSHWFVPVAVLRRVGLAAESETSDDLLILFLRSFLDVIQQLATLRNQGQKSTPGRKVLFMDV